MLGLTPIAAVAQAALDGGQIDGTFGVLQVEWLHGSTIYFLVRSSNALIATSSSYVVYDSGHYSNYPQPSSEQGYSGYFVGNMPTFSPPGIYNVLAKLQAGASPAETDKSIGAGVVPWDGTAVPGYPINLSKLAISGAGAVTTNSVVDKTGYSLSAQGLDLIMVEAGVNARQGLGLAAAAAAAKLQGAATDTVTIYAANDPNTVRILAEVDANGNRNNVTLYLPT